MDQNGKKPLWPEEVFIGRNNIPKEGTCKSGIEPRKSWEVNICQGPQSKGESLLSRYKNLSGSGSRGSFIFLIKT